MSSSKWREGILPRARINEYVLMLIGPNCDNEARSKAIKTLLKMLNEQQSLDAMFSRERAERKRLAREDAAALLNPALKTAKD